jgi:F0F1-type ATP synthase assembly protein I
MSYVKRIKDIAIETLIAVVLVGAFVAYLLASPTKGRNLDWRLISNFVNTLVVFGFLISWFRHAWRNVSFWAMLTVLLIGHIAAYAFALGRVQHLPLVFYAVLNVIELTVFTRILRMVSLRGSDQK